MGRARLAMEFIQREKARKTTFQKRKKGLMKKTYEFSTLCGVDACLIIYPESEDQAETWPRDPREVRRIIEKYKNNVANKRLNNYDVYQFFKERKNKVETEIAKKRKEIMKIMYPTWDESFNSLGEQQLRAFVGMLDVKLEACNQRIKMLKTQRLLMQKASEISDAGASSFSHAQLSLAPMNPLNDNSQLLSLCPVDQFENCHFDSNVFQFTGKNNEMFNIDQFGIPNMLGSGSNIASSSRTGAMTCYKKSQVLLDNEDEVNRIFPMSYYDGSVAPMQLSYNNNYLGWQNFLAQNIQYEAPLQTLPAPPMDGFQTNESGYYDLLQAQMFNNAKKEP